MLAWHGADWSVALGYASIASWLIPGMAQLLENYRNKSGDGLSLVFVYIWLLGDFLNGVGALRQGLLSTIVYLAFWYVFTDVVLLVQILLYSNRQTGPSVIEEEEALLAADQASQPTTTYGSSSTHAPPLSEDMERVAQDAALADAQEQAANEHKSSFWLRALSLYALGFLFVAAVGVAGRYIQGPAALPDPHKPHAIKWDAQTFGWFSAFLYLSSRIPQIRKNRTTKCEGLSMSLFVYAVSGNATYVASILALSTERRYVLENLSWLIGSAAVIFLDFVVLFQFIHYAPDRRRMRLDRLVQETKRRNQSAVRL